MKRTKLQIWLLAGMSGILLTACGNAGGTAESISIDNFMDSSDMTQEDKQRKYLAYLEKYMEEDLLENLPDVTNATVTLSGNTDAGAADKDGGELHVAVILELSDELTSCTAPELADLLAAAIGNASTDNIIIQDTEGTLLFPE